MAARITRTLSASNSFMNFRYSIRTLLAVCLTLSIGVALTAQRVNTQRNAISVIENCGGSAFHETRKLTQSFANNLRYSVTNIEIPNPETNTTFLSALDTLPNLKRIEITIDYDQVGIARMRSRFPDVEIEHSFAPLIGLIQ